MAIEPHLHDTLQTNPMKCDIYVSVVEEEQVGQGDDTADLQVIVFADHELVDEDTEDFLGGKLVACRDALRGDILDGLHGVEFN